MVAVDSGADGRLTPVVPWSHLLPSTLPRMTGVFRVVRRISPTGSSIVDQYHLFALRTRGPEILPKSVYVTGIVLKIGMVDIN